MLYKLNESLDAVLTDCRIDGDPMLDKRRMLAKSDVIIRPFRWRRWRKIGVHVSTVFLCVDHAYDGGPPVLWETMLFTAYDPLENSCWRYTSTAAALRGHRSITLLLARNKLRAVDDLAPYVDPVV